MSKYQVGAKNGQWKGGRSVASNGYVLIRVGVGHHLADVRGYAYEHRLVAELMLDRRLRPGEAVHHKDENKRNNDPSNLQVMSSNAEHMKLHLADITEAVLEFTSNFPCTRGQLAEYLSADPVRVGWALSRLRKRGLIYRNSFGSWSIAL